MRACKTIWEARRAGERALERRLVLIFNQIEQVVNGWEGGKDSVVIIKQTEHKLR
jgi:predicted phosphoadenosine phosphosulfate sulfurtransferase